MKTVQFLAVCVLFILQSNLLSAQTNDLAEFTKQKPEKSRIFQRMPAKFSVFTASMDRLFTLKENSKVTIPLDGTNFFEGTVMEKVQQNEQVTTINISSSNFDGALLTLSRRAIPGQPVTYVGRVVSMKHGDALTMTVQGDEIVFSKQQQSLTVAE